MPSPKPVSVAVIDCGAGNLHSVRKALASQLPMDASLNITTSATDLATATHIVLPGVGAFADCMSGLTALPGMRDALENAVLKNETPFLGICVGMQMLFERGHEHGTHQGLGWFKGEVGPLAPTNPNLRIPHMGWNRLQQNPIPYSPPAGESKSASAAPRDSVGGPQTATPPPPPTDVQRAHPAPPQGGSTTNHPFFNEIENNSFVYFVHSYAAQNAAPEEVLATVDYGGDVVSVIGRKNMIATQFHPEKSQAIGLRMIRNFLTM